MERKNKKLLEATTWYKENKVYEDTEEDQLIVDFLRSTDGAWKKCREKEKEMMGNNDFKREKEKARLQI